MPRTLRELAPTAEPMSRFDLLAKKPNQAVQKPSRILKLEAAQKILLLSIAEQQPEEVNIISKAHLDHVRRCRNTILTTLLSLQAALEQMGIDQNRNPDTYVPDLILELEADSKGPDADLIRKYLIARMEYHINQLRVAPRSGGESTRIINACRRAITQFGRDPQS